MIALLTVLLAIPTHAASPKLKCEASCYYRLKGGIYRREEVKGSSFKALDAKCKRLHKIKGTSPDLQIFNPHYDNNSSETPEFFPATAEKACQPKKD